MPTQPVVNMESVVDELERLLSLASQHVDAVANARSDKDPDHYYEEEGHISEAVGRARKVIGLALEVAGARQWRKRADAELKKSAQDVVSHNDQGDPYSPALEAVYSWLEILKTVYGIKSGLTAQRAHLRHLLEQTADIMHMFNVEPTKEKDISDRVYEVIKLSFPDAVFEPKLSRPLGFFKPEFGIRSLGTLVEYKYTVNEAATKKIFAGIYEDMKVYSGIQEWEQFIAVVYVADDSANMKALRSEWDMGVMNDAWELILVGGRGSRKKR